MFIIVIAVGIIMIISSGNLTRKFIKKNAPDLLLRMDNASVSPQQYRGEIIERNILPIWISHLNVGGYIIVVIGAISFFVL